MKLNDTQVNAFADSIRNGGEVFDVLYIGGGVAALSGALYSARDGFKTLVLEGTMISNTEAPGGALLLTSEIENFPGFPKGAGAELVETMRDQALNFGADIREERAEHLEASLEHGKCHVVTTDEGNVYFARAVVIATGAKARLLGVPGEDEFLGRGVSTCGTCDGFMFKDKKVVIVGGGDTACEDTLLLTRYASHVTMLVRGNALRSTGPEARIITDHPDVEIIYNTRIESIESEDGKITKVVTSGDFTGEIETDGVFIAIGSDPASGFLSDSVVMRDPEGYVKVLDDSTRIQGGVPGVYAAGDVADKVYRQAITSAGKGVQAALEARHYLNTPVPEAKESR